ncbi:MAG TPA: 50S ribosomal protein L11 methyltransferase [Acidobacteriota bacterium]|nr:50S ribosomal protein L11 methyltransferase [Acidobacteriota bacterium]
MDDQWVQVSLRCSPADKESVWAILYQFECVGLQETEPDHCRAYFPARVDPDSILESLRACPSVQSAEVSILLAQDWHARWMENYHSFSVGPFYIRPGWESGTAPHGAVEIVMDPKGAFGTGTHPTTQLCLLQLPHVLNERRSGIDLGCGSGILSIAAKKFAPQLRLAALDSDFEACLVCRENAVINHVDFPIVCAAFGAIHNPMDLIISNLQLDELVHLAADFHRLTLSGALLLLSGILAEQESDLRRAYDPLYQLKSVRAQDEWLAFVYQRV